MKTSFSPFFYSKKMCWGQSCYLLFCGLSSCVCSCPKKSQKDFHLKLFTILVFILQSTCFICTSWKCKQTMEQQSHGACEWAKSKQKQNKSKVTLHLYWPPILLSDLAQKQCNGIIKGWLHYLMSESKGRFLVNNILLAWCLVMAQIQFSLIKQN